jgi:hypothetical protein
MTAPIVNGYVVVDSPRVDFSYRGVDRQPWDLVEAHYYEGRLPEHLCTIFERIRSAENRGFWWPVSRSRSAAEALLKYTESQGCSSEIVGVWSPYLELVGGKEGSITNESVMVVGVDIIAVGEWSLLRCLQEVTDRGAAKSLAQLLNPYGLLNDAADVRHIEELYRTLSGIGIVEPIADPNSGLPVEPVSMFLLK